LRENMNFQNLDSCICGNEKKKKNPPKVRKLTEDLGEIF
jgi:hypothetical protein